jgi:hypothetical protein
MEETASGRRMQLNPDSGIITRQSSQSVTETISKIEELLQAKGIQLFAVIDHSGEAEKAGLKMPPTQLLIFGNPKGGTPVMLAAPGSCSAIARTSASSLTLYRISPPESSRNRPAHCSAPFLICSCKYCP